MIPNTPTHARPLAAAALLLLTVALAACGGSSQADPASEQVSTKQLDPANFDDPATGRNPYLPLVPGTQSVREGTTGSAAARSRIR